MIPKWSGLCLHGHFGIWMGDCQEGNSCPVNCLWDPGYKCQECPIQEGQTLWKRGQSPENRDIRHPSDRRKSHYHVAGHLFLRCCDNAEHNPTALTCLWVNDWFQYMIQYIQYISLITCWGEPVSEPCKAQQCLGSWGQQTSIPSYYHKTFWGWTAFWSYW